jgi:hypothetical protein
MRRVAAVIGVGVATWLAAGTASAQTCFGNAPFDQKRPYQAGGAIDFSPNVTSYLGTFAGGNQSAFGLVGLGGTAYDALGASTLDTTVTVGGQVATDPNRRVVICPFGTVQNIFGPNNLAGSGATVWTLDLGGGAAVGVVAVRTSTVQLIPGFAVLVDRERTRTTLGSASVVENATVGRIVIGAGLVLNGRAGIVPKLLIPVNVANANKVFEISFSVNFGG